MIVQAGKAPIVDGQPEERMRVGCGSATVGIFAQQWLGHVDEVIVVDDHITGVLTEHQAGRVPRHAAGRHPRARAQVDAGALFPGRQSRARLGRHRHHRSAGASSRRSIPKVAWPGLRLLMTSTTGEDALYCVLDEKLQPVPAEMPAAVRAVVERIGENCEPSLCTVLFMAGAGGSLRAGVTENPVLLTRSVATGETRVTMGGAPVYVWPGGGITVMVDVTRMPKNAFGYVPTPAIVAPIEFTLPRALYERLGGHAGEIVSAADMLAAVAARGADGGLALRQSLAVRAAADEVMSKARTTAAESPSPLRGGVRGGGRAVELSPVAPTPTLPAPGCAGAKPNRLRRGERGEGGRSTTSWKTRSASCCGGRTSGRAASSMR